MDSSCQNIDLNAKYLLGQLNTARKEINNLRQQIKSLRYMHEKDINNIKRLLEIHKCETSTSEQNVISLEDIKPSTSTDDGTLKFKPIGIISTWFPNKRGTPRQPGICEKAPGKITLYNSIFTNPDHALEGLHDFSHMWILFYFHRNDSTHVRAKVAPPRLNGIRTGVFSTRSPHRPCPIGLSLVKILKIESNIIYFEGVDMVDQTPILDIKPYIPQYDSPLHIEKLCNRSIQSSTNDNNSLECSEENVSADAEHVFTSLGVDLQTANDSRDMLLDSYCRSGSYNTVQEIDISRDEEIALRLQAEEFQENPDFENYSDSRNFYEFSELNFENSNIVESHVQTASINGTLRTTEGTLPNARSPFTTVIENNAYSPSQSISTGNVINRLQNIHLSSQNNIDSVYISRDSEGGYAESYVSRSSRLLDGADGPNTVCGTDLDLFYRRALNSRVDNSPVRMGIREAPDGEEGFQSQNLTTSQTLSNIHVTRTTSDNDLLESLNNSSLSVTEPQEITFADVRVPDWVLRPRSATLSVVFNERALIQLNEILEDKADEQRTAIENVLREDPRSVYLRQRWGNQFYTFLIHDLHITCKFDDSRGAVTVFQIRHAGRTCECGEPEWQCLGHSPLP